MIQPEPIDEEFLAHEKVIENSFERFGSFSSCFQLSESCRCKTLGDLAKLEISDMMKFRNFGKKSLAELEQLDSRERFDLRDGSF
jgi:DNA-directed RNA polymerase subunit alpha